MLDFARQEEGGRAYLGGRRVLVAGEELASPVAAAKEERREVEWRRRRSPVEWSAVGDLCRTHGFEIE